MCLGIAGRVVEIVDRDAQHALIDVDGTVREASLAVLGLADDDGASSDGVRVGDWVLLHLGFAIEKLDPEEAESMVASLRDLAREEDEAISRALLEREPVRRPETA